MISLIMHPRDQACSATLAPAGVPRCAASGRYLPCRLRTRADGRDLGAQVSRVAKMLADEFGTASNIKNRVNRQVSAPARARCRCNAASTFGVADAARPSQSVLGAITSAQQRLKLYNKARCARVRCCAARTQRIDAARLAQVPPNGLVLYTGTILTDEGKEKKVNIDFEPFKTINTSLYLCDNKFHTEALSELLESENKYGFIVMDGNGSLFGTLSGNTREILHKFSVDLPKKHGRGGQSALRFARLRMEKRHNYVRKARDASGSCRPHRIAFTPAV